MLCQLKERRKKFRIYRCHPVYIKKITISSLQILSLHKKYKKNTLKSGPRSHLCFLHKAGLVSSVEEHCILHNGDTNLNGVPVLRIRIRVKVKGRIRIRVKVKGRIWNRIKVKGRIRNRSLVKSRIRIRFFIFYKFGLV